MLDNFTGANPDGQVERIDPSRCRVYERKDGIYAVAFDAGDNILHLNALHMVQDQNWAFGDAGIVTVTTGSTRPTGALHDLKRALDTPDLSAASIDALFANPDVRAIVELSNLRAIAMAEVDSLIDGLGATLCLTDPDEFAGLLEALLENARDLLASLRQTPTSPS